MKLFDIDWQDFLWRAIIWDRIAPESRNAFVRIEGKASTTQVQFGDDLPLLLEHRFLASVKNDRCRVHEDCRDFARAARGMSRRMLFFPATGCDMNRYLDVHFLRHERQGLYPSHTGYYHADAHLSRLISSVAWVRSFLTAEDVAAWEAQRCDNYHGSPGLFGWNDVTAAARQLITRLMADPQPVPFPRLPDLLPDASVDVIGATVLATLRYGLLFAGMNEQWTPLIGLWPGVAERLRRPPAAEPAVVTPERQFQAAWIFEDLTTLLVAVAGQPLRVRTNDGRLFAKAVQDLEPRLFAMPDWIPAVFAHQNAEDRLSRVQHMAEAMELANRTHGRRPELRATRAGQRWLAATPKERLQTLLVHCAALSDQTFGTDHMYGPQRKREPDLPAALKTAYASLPEDGFVLFHEFLAWQCDHSNPYTARAEAGNRVHLRSSWYQHEPTTEEMEVQWERDLTEYSEKVLLLFGGLKIGYLEPDDTLCVALTDVGRFFLGLCDDFSYEADQLEEGQVVVQPNFEIAFLSPAPLAEAALARFATRKGSGLGTLFRLTKAAIFDAASGGVTCDQVLDTLGRVSTKQLPKNVVREIKGWFGQCRQVQVKTTPLIHCPDADTAARVVAAGGKQTELLTDTVVAMSNAKAKPAVVKKLKKAGIFVDRSGGKGEG